LCQLQRLPAELHPLGEFVPNPEGVRKEQGYNLENNGKKFKDSFFFAIF